MVLKVFIPIILQILYITMEVGRIEEGRKEERGELRKSKLTDITLSPATIPASTHLLIKIFRKNYWHPISRDLNSSQIGVPFPHKHNSSMMSGPSAEISIQSPLSRPGRDQMLLAVPISGFILPCCAVFPCPDVITLSISLWDPSLASLT